jgi:hypothetical protein
MGCRRKHPSNTMRGMLQGTARKALAATIVVFLAVHAWIAFGYQPKMSDTALYATYAFVLEAAARKGQSPYDSYEESHRSSNRAHNRPPPRFDEVTIEYPPLALQMLRAPLAFLKNPSEVSVVRQKDIDDWTEGFRRLYFFAHAVIIVAAVLWLRRRGYPCTWGLAVATIAGAVLMYVLYDRLDLWLGLLLLGMLSALVTGHRNLAMIALAAAVNLKLVPAFLVPLAVLGALPAAAFANGPFSRASLRAAARALGVFAASGLAMFLPFRLAWGPRVWDFLAYHGKRGFQIESIWSSVLLLAAQFGYPARVDHVFGADEVIGPGTPTLAKVSVLVVLGLVLIVYVVAWRSLGRRPPSESDESAPTSRLTLAEQRPQLFVWASLAILSAAMATSKVFSPQYLCWFLPVLLLVEPPRRLREAVPSAVFLVVCGLTTLVYPILWTEVFRAIIQQGKIVIFLPTLRAILLMLTRNMIWLGFSAIALVQLRSAKAVVEALPEPHGPKSRGPRRRKRR